MRLTLELRPALVELDQAVPCGLIVNELMSNSLKHAFTGGRSGEVLIRLRPEAAGKVQMHVGDDGAGLPADFEARRLRSLGLQLVTDLTRQIGGHLEIGSGPGAGFTISFAPTRGTTGPLFPTGEGGAACHLTPLPLPARR